MYAIQHNRTKRIYVGSSCEVRQRYINHMSLLRNGNHLNEDMQKDFDEYGEDYSLFILDRIDSYWERKKEFEWMLKLNSHIRGCGYNYKDTEPTIRNHAKSCIPLSDGIPTPISRSDADDIART